MSRPSPSSDGVVRRRLLRGLAALPLLALALSMPVGRAAAQSAKLLDAPRIAGLVGERYDGYAVAHGKVSADVAALIDKVNAERRAVYEKRAAADHVPVDAVQQIYAQQIRQSAPVGTWFLGANGQWSQK
jgi:uncharacterized protein